MALIASVNSCKPILGNPDHLPNIHVLNTSNINVCVTWQKTIWHDYLTMESHGHKTREQLRNNAPKGQIEKLFLSRGLAIRPRWIICVQTL